MKFKDLNLKYTYRSDSKNIPLLFYESVFPYSTEINLTLGYFSSNAFRELSCAFSRFIINGGVIKIITNQFFSKEDYDNLIDKNQFDEDNIFNLTYDINKLQKSLDRYGKHFFNCLRFLIKEKRLFIQPVRWGSGQYHAKHMILFDGENYISTDGSSNFTLSGLTINGEKFSVKFDWENERRKEDILTEYDQFNKIFNRESTEYQYHDPDFIVELIEEVGDNKNKNELLRDSIDLLPDNEYHAQINQIREKRMVEFKSVLHDFNSKPRFPDNGSPREYQKLAYEKWIKNDKSGIFNMATGTGKTITALNIILSEYRDSNRYKAVILVPTVALLNQWIIECKKFNFLEIISIKDRDWKSRINNIELDRNLGIDSNFILISTYATFSKSSFQKIYKKLSLNQTYLIADECHNVGSQSLVKLLPQEIKYRIGLSATPQRKYDLEGSEKMYDYFNSYPECFTFSYSMQKAILNGNLSRYFYHPIYCSLNENELERYRSYSKRLLINYDEKTNTFSEEGKRLLIERKRIIHKAKNKLDKLRDLLENKDGLKYTFIYVPEGKEINYEEDEEIEDIEDDKKIIKEYLNSVMDAGYTARTVVSSSNDRESALSNFKKGKINMLLAMKILDEGVDIPITQNAIFCSSTGNPRQFIQRRGRVLRKHPNKEFAKIFDLVVIPTIDHSSSQEIRMEKNILRSEILRVANFIYSAENKEELLSSELKNICDKFDIDLAELTEINIVKDKKCDYELS